MDFPNKILISLLLIGGFVTSSLSENSAQNYETDAGEGSCNETERTEFISLLRRKKLGLDHKNVLLIISDSENDIFRRIIKEILINRSSRRIVYIPVLSKLKEEDMRQIFRIGLVMEPGNYIGIIMHSESIDKIAEILVDFATTFGEKLAGFIKLVVTLDHDEDGDKVIEKLKEISYNSNRTNVINMVNYMHKLGDDEQITMINNQSSESVNVDKINEITSTLYDFDIDEFKPTLSRHFQELINCLVASTNKEILSDMRNFVSMLKSYFSFDVKKCYNIFDLEPVQKLETDYRYLWNVQRELPGTKNPTDFLKTISGLAEYLNITDKFEELDFLQNMEIIRLVLTVTSDIDAFSGKAWSQPLQEFISKNPEEMSQWYKEDGSILLKQTTFTNLCTKEGSCNETDSTQFLSVLIREKLRVVPSNEIITLVISDSENYISRRLKERASIFIPVQSKFKEDDIRQIFRFLLLLEPWQGISIIMHSARIDQIAELLQDFTNSFGDKLSQSISLVVTLDHDEDKYKVMEKLNELRYKSIRKEFISTVKLMSMFLHDKITIINNQSPESEIANKIGNIRKHATKKQRIQTLFNPFQDSIKCAIDTANKTILPEMRNFVSKLESFFGDELKKIHGISEVERADKQAIGHHYLTLISKDLPRTQNATDFQEIMRGFVENLNITKALYLLQNMTLIRLLLSASSDHYEFSTTAEAWSQPLREFRPNTSDILNRYYQQEESGQWKRLDLDNYTICTNMTKGQKLQVMTDYIRLSYVNLNKCSGNVRLVEIFATNKVFIDVDLDQKGKMLQFVIIAPTWEVVGRRTINLSGEDGKAIEIQAKNGSTPGNKNGAHGMAGLPGGPAGSFYGIANTINNARNLNILANGGNGGPGQDGGNGSNGEDGRSYEGMPKFNCREGKVPGWNVIFYNEHKETTLHSPFIIISLRSYKVIAKAGKRGGRGGNGGVGGTGGKGGNIIVQQLLKHDLGMDPVISTKNGEKGAGGFGRNGGLGGKNGNHMDIDCESSYRFVTGMTKIDEDTGFAERGLLGKPGTSLKMRKTPENARIVQNFPSAVNEYKFFARIQLARLELDQRNILSKFYDSLNTQENVTKWYDTLSLVEDFTQLEQQYFYMRKQVNLTSSYEMLSERILNYMKNIHRTNENHQEYKNVLRDLYRDVKDKISKIHVPDVYPVRMNYKSDFESLAKKPINTLKEPVAIDNILLFFDEEKQRLDNLIEQAQQMISNEVQPAINDLENILGEEINTLLIENTGLKTIAYDKMSELAENRKQLQNVITLKLFCAPLKIAGAALGLINPAFALAGDMVSSAVSVFEGSLTSADPGKLGIDVPESVKTASTTAGKLYEGEKKSLLDEQQKFFLQRANKQAKIKSHDTKIRAAQVLQTGSESVISLMNDQKKLDEIDKAMQNSQVVLKQLDQYEEQVYNATEPMLENMKEMLNEAGKKMSIQNENELLMTKWNMTETIKNVQRSMQTMAKGFNVTEDITWTLEKLTRTFEQMSVVNTQVLEYENRKANQKFITGLHIAHKSNLFIRDARLRSLLGRLQLFLAYNVVSDSYDKWLFEFKQAAFPYAGHFLQHFEMPDIFTTNDTSQKVDDMAKNIAAFEEILDNKKDFDPFVMGKTKGKFMGTTSAYEKAYYIWKSENYKKEIRHILDGKETKLVANITGPKTENPRTEDGLKFCRIEILFTSKKHEIQHKLYNNFKYFDAILTHHGDSNYKCNDSIYEIRNTPTTLRYSFWRTSEDCPEIPDKMYTKLLEGECMLSPFATWSIQLKPRDNKNFKMLEQFKDNVDLELIGTGEQMTDSNGKCEYNMEKYYKKIGSITRVKIFRLGFDFKTVHFVSKTSMSGSVS